MWEDNAGNGAGSIIEEKIFYNTYRYPCLYVQCISFIKEVRAKPTFKTFSHIKTRYVFIEKMENERKVSFHEEQVSSWDKSELSCLSETWYLVYTEYHHTQKSGFRSSAKHPSLQTFASTSTCSLIRYLFLSQTITWREVELRANQ